MSLSASSWKRIVCVIGLSLLAGLPPLPAQAQPPRRGPFRQPLNPQQAQLVQPVHGVGGGASAGPATGAPANLASPSLNGQLDAAIEKHFSDENLPGLVVLYARDGMLVYKKSLGFSDVENQVKMNEHRVGRWNSVSKWAAAIIALKQVEQGKLDLSASAKSQLPDLPDHHTYTLRDLLACRSGVRHYGETTSPQSPTGWSGNNFATAMDAAPMLWDDPLAGPVGSYHYSTHGYTIFGAALEQATGKSVGELIQSTLATPYGLSTIKAEDLSDNNPARMKFYTKSGNGNVQVQPENSTWKVLGGGMESSALDMLKLGVLLGDGKIISKSNVKKMMTRLDFEDSYCLGCNHAVENGNHVMAKSGSFKGSNAYIWLVPDRRMVMVVMANRDEAGTSTLGKKLRGIILAEKKAEGEKPDLIVKDFAKTGTPQHKNGHWEIPVSFKVVNQGLAGADASFVNGVQLGTTFRFSSFTDGLPPSGAAKTVSGVVKFPDAGKLYAGRTVELVAFADAPIAAADTSMPWYGRVNEASETNNKAILSVKIPGGGLDLTGQKPTVPSQGGASVPPRLVGQPQQPAPSRPQVVRPQFEQPQPGRPKRIGPKKEQPRAPQRVTPSQGAFVPSRTGGSRLPAIVSAARPDSQPGGRADGGQKLQFQLNEANNIYHRATARLPDLRIRDMRFADRQPKVVHVAIGNAGQVPAAASVVRLTVRKINGTSVGRTMEVAVPALGPAQTSVIALDASSILPSSVDLKATTFRVDADATKVVPESDEANNLEWHNL